ncbi:MAG: hypothetical protein IH831_05865 [Planctomycetes bacterium]|nr:hypothetical protein [Planctomycetota bacterium]
MRALGIVDLNDTVFYCAFFTPEGQRFSEADIGLILDELDIDTLGLHGTMAYFSVTRTFLSEHKNGQDQYRLLGNARREFEQRNPSLATDPEPELKEVSTELQEMAGDVSDDLESTFLDEALTCLKAQAYRAAIVMGWKLAYYHVRSWIIAEHLQAFNAELTKRYRNKTKLYDPVSCHDDFPDGEHFVLSVCRDCKILDKKRFRLLEPALIERNNYAHPSSLQATAPHAAGYISNLVKNVLLHPYFAYERT